MLKVSDIWAQLQQVTGTCDETEIYRFLNAAVEILSNKGNWDPLVGFADICTQGSLVVLPREIETPLAVNIGGSPANFRSKWFEFHLNGPGSDCCACRCGWAWEDLGFLPTYRRVTENTNLVFTSTDDTDVGALVLVYGKDGDGLTLVHDDSATGTTVPGLIYSIKSSTSQTDTRDISQIDNIVKPVTQGFVTLTGRTEEDTTGTVMGIYEPDETIPEYRRLSISGSCGVASCGCAGCSGEENLNTTWVRMRFRRRTFSLSRQSDLIFLHSPMAIKTAVQAVRSLESNDREAFNQYMETALMFINDKEKRIKGPSRISMQFQSRAWAGGAGQSLI